MRDTIVKLEFVAIDKTNDLSFYPAGSTVAISQLTDQALKNIPILVGKSSLEANQLNESYGVVHDVVITSLVSTKDTKNRLLLNYLTAQNGVYVVTTSCGAKKIIGSKAYPARATFSEKTSDLNSTYYTLTVTSKSPHGVYLAK